MQEPRAIQNSNASDAFANSRKLVWLSGVIAPLISIALWTWLGVMRGGITGNSLHDFGYILLALVVPLVNWHLLVKLRQPNDKGLSPEWSLYNGFAIAISLVGYGLFLPLAHALLCSFAASVLSLLRGGLTGIEFSLWLIAIIWAPMIFAPLGAMFAGFLLHRQTLLSTGQSRVHAVALAIGLIVGLPLILSYDGDRLLCRSLLANLQSMPVEKERFAVKLLRELNCSKELLALCYAQTGPPLDIDTLLFRLQSQIPVPLARQLYYKVNGQSFNEVPAPPTTQRSVFSRTDDADWAADEVGGRSQGLVMTESHITGEVNADYGAAALEWNIIFNNPSAVMKEARAQILLPPGGVISDATLWMNGSPVKATFCDTQTARDIYRNIVLVQHHDPLLVRTCGPDRILMQCFPVMPKSDMQLCLSMSAPVQFSSTSMGAVAMPRIVERNFESSAQAKSNAVKVHIHDDGGVRDISGDFSDAELANLEMRVAKDASKISSLATRAGIVTQRIEQQSMKPLDDIEIVIDGSVGMSKHSAELTAALRSMSDGRSVHVFIASDEIALRELAIPAALAELKELRFAGGPDNVPALAEACKRAHASRNGGVVWLHGSQPVLFEKSSAQLSTLLSRDCSNVRIVDVQIVKGPNRFAENLDAVINRNKPVLVSLQSSSPQDLQAQLKKAVGGGCSLFIKRTLVGAPTVNAPKAAPKLALGSSPRFDSLAEEAAVEQWNYSRVREKLLQGNVVEAAIIGSQSRLVTPVTAALVFESGLYVPGIADAHRKLEQWGPGLDGVLRWELTRAFEAVVNQLNGLSAGAGSGSSQGASSATNSTYSNFSHSAAATQPKNATVQLGTSAVLPASANTYLATSAASVREVETNTAPSLVSASARAQDIKTGAEVQPETLERELNMWQTPLSWLISLAFGVCAFIIVIRLKTLSLRTRTTFGFALAACSIAATLWALHVVLPAACNLICLFS